MTNKHIKLVNELEKLVTSVYHIIFNFSLIKFFFSGLWEIKVSRTRSLAIFYKFAE